MLNIALVNATPPSCPSAPVPTPYFADQYASFARGYRVVRQSGAAPDLRASPQGLPVPSNSESLSASTIEHFQRSAIRCELVPVKKYFFEALMELVGTTGECPKPCLASNAQLRRALVEVLALHPEGDTISVDAMLKDSAPSLLLDDPSYSPGTLKALRYDMGANAVKIGLLSTGDEPPDEEDFLFFGQSEMMFLNDENTYRNDVARRHSSAIGFHYTAAGMPGYALQPGTRRKHSSSLGRIADFVAHLETCQQRRDAQSATTSAERHRPSTPPPSHCTLT